MNLRYITCSDPREDLSTNSLLDLLKISPRVELGIQAHRGPMSAGAPRNKWLHKLLSDARLEMDGTVNVAIHVNFDWCSKFCNGIIVPELMELFDMPDSKTGNPLIKRWQLNIGDGTSDLNVQQTAKLIQNNPDREFIFPYNTQPHVVDFIQKLDNTGTCFSLLYDASYGAGISPDTWNGPAYINHPMGYAGGMSPDNVTHNLDQISQVVPQKYTTWIDAEGQMMIPGTRKFDVARAQRYIQNALRWQTEHNK